MPQKAEKRENRKNTSRKDRPPTAPALFISHARVWPIKHITRSVMVINHDWKEYHKHHKLFSKKNRLSDSQNVFRKVWRNVFYRFSAGLSVFWLTIFKSKQSYQAPEFLPEMAFDLFLSWIKRSFSRSGVSAEWLLISYIGGTPQSSPFRRNKKETNYGVKQRNGVERMECNGIEWNEMEWS